MKTGKYGLAVLISMVFIVAGLCPQAGATPFTGTPSNGPGTFPDPLFGTLINFDDITAVLPDGSMLPTNKYAGFSIGELIGTALVDLTVLPLSDQSLDNYVLAEDPPTAILMHTVQIRFSEPQARVGIGIIDDVGGQELQIFDKDHNSIGSSYSPQFSEGNAYAGFNEDSADIIFFEISGEFFALDDLQFSPVPVPEPGSVMLLLVGLVGLVGFVRKKSGAGA